MWVTNAKAGVLSIVTGGGKWVEIILSADPLYQHLLLTATCWRCVELYGEPPRLFGIEPPRPRINPHADRRHERIERLGWNSPTCSVRQGRIWSTKNPRSNLFKSLMPED